MPNFTAVASDTFTGSDENPLVHDSSGNVAWTTTTGNTAMRRISNVAGPSNGNADCASYWSKDAFNANQYSRATLQILTATSGGGRGMGLTVRTASGANTMYRFVIDHAASSNAEVARIKAGVYNVLGSRWTQTFTDGDQFTLAVEGTGTSTVVYVYDKNGSQVYSFADSGAGDAIDSGSAGICYSSIEGTSHQIDNWEGGTFATSTNITPTVVAATLTGTQSVLSAGILTRSMIQGS